MWKSNIWHEPARDHSSGPEPAPAVQAWIDRVSQEPWVQGLLKLTERRGWWAGTEYWLLGKLREFAGDEVYRSSDFPDSLDRLQEYAAIAYEPFQRLGLDVADYREIPADYFAYYFDVPEWDWDNNVLVYRGDAALRGYYIEALNHPDPLPVTLLLIAAESRTGAHKSWSGSTAELRGALLGQRGLADHRVDEYLELFGTWDKTDHAAFHERIDGCVPFLREMGVHVRKYKPESCRQTTETGGDREGYGEEEDGTRWTIEVPAWKHKRGHAD